MTVFTVGHSTRTIADFIALLRPAGVERAVDVRAIARSRTNPQFNTEALRASLAAAGMDYVHLPALGGRRGRSGSGPSPNALWRNAAFRNYADYAAGDEFRAGLAELKALAERDCSAIMCAEAVWWRCHRALISDYLKVRGIEVMHIVDANKGEPHRYTAAAQIVNGELSYAPSEPLL